MQVLDHGYVTYIEHWGSDERIIEAARMSTDGGFKGWGPFHDPTCNVSIALWKDLARCNCSPKDGDEKLLRYLYEHKHMTPFEMAGLVIEVQAPIFVVREWHRHRTQSYNEMSGRYTVLPDLYYIPNIDRIQRQSSTNKQASGEPFDPEQATTYRGAIIDATHYARTTYEEMINAGVAREVARMVLPVNQYTRMRASANLRNWLAFLELRLAPNAQWEIQQYALAVAHIIAEHFPRTYALFNAGRSAG